jgi:hypothetical protein
MYKVYYQFLFTVLCVVGVSCILHNTSVETLELANPNTEELHDDQCSQKQEQNSKMTLLEQHRTLLLAQDYQGALELMPELEKELRENVMLQKEMVAKDRIESDPYIETLRGIRTAYCYLYMVLGRDEEALQKIKEIELPVDTDPELAYFDIHGKLRILERLNMVDEVIDEAKTLLNNPNIGHRLQTDSPVCYAEIMSTLLLAQLVKGDFDSAQNTIDQFRNYLRGRPTYVSVRAFSESLWIPPKSPPRSVGHSTFGEELLQVPSLGGAGVVHSIDFNPDQFLILSSEVLQYHTRYSNFLSVAEYYINNLTETHIACYVKCEPEPPIPDPDNSGKCILPIQGNGCGFVSKVDGSFFAFDDIPVEPEHDPFPLQDSLSEPQDELESVPKLSPPYVLAY